MSMPVTFNAPTVGSIAAIVVALIGLALSAFNSGSEIAYFSLTKDDVEDIADESVRARVARLLKKPEKLLATILIGNNLVNIMISTVMTYALSQMVTFGGKYGEVASFIVETVLLTFLILLFGEVIPKLYATNYNSKCAQAVSTPLGWAVKLFTPLSALLVSGTSVVGKVVTKHDDQLSVDDLSRALQVSDVKNENEKELLEGILTFGDKTVGEIMRPRVDVVDIDYDSKFDDVVARVIDTGYSRLPVYDGTPDTIRGILYAKDLLPYIGKRDNDFRWQNLLRPAYLVPKNRKIDDLLEDFRKKKMHMAIIVDEFACTQGIATLEDVLEEIVGDIDDEYDTEEKFYSKQADGSYLFDAKTTLSDFARVLDIDDEEIDALGEPAEDAETIAGLLLNLKGDFLTMGEVVKAGRFTFTVTKMDHYRIDRVKVELAPADADEKKKDKKD